MNAKRPAVGAPMVALSVIAVVLAAGLAASYAITSSEISSLNSQVSTLNNQIASLKQTGRAVCQEVQNLSQGQPDYRGFLVNMSGTLLRQIQSDRSIISTLNSTKPSGYSSIMTSLNDQIIYDQFAVNQSESFFPGSFSLPPGPNCTLFD